VDRPRSEVLRASPPLFASSRLDAFTRCRPIVPPLIYVPVIVLLAVLGTRGAGLWQAGVAFLGGYAFWTFCEYWIHRVVFHLEPRSELGARLHWIFHGVHHDHPSDPMRLVMPPIVTVPLAAGFLGLFVAALGTSLGFAVGAGFFAGYLFYDMLHYALHHRRPKSRVGKRLHELHMRHHFQDDERCFGVSAPWWDTVFGTAAARRPSGRR
jgi:sterol desaturase/sphingolipid hydroxylase (fatty acid hydroxylase superfamily)